MRIRKETILRTVRLAEEWRSRSTGDASHTSRIALQSFLLGLPHQELIVLMAMMSVGRGDPGSDDFPTLVNNIHMTAERIVAYLLEKPHLADDLEKGMRKVGLNWAVKSPLCFDHNRK
jgi:hypothetical protein